MKAGVWGVCPGKAPEQKFVVIYHSSSASKETL